MNRHTNMRLCDSRNETPPEHTAYGLQTIQRDQLDLSSTAAAAENCSLDAQNEGPA